MFTLQSSARKTEVDLHVFNERSFIILLQWEELMDFPGGSDGKESAHNVGDLGLFDPWAGKIPWRRKSQLIPVFLPGEFHEQRGLVGYSPWGHKESDMTEGLNTHTHIHTHTHTHTHTTSIKKENKKEHQRSLLNGKENCWFCYGSFQLNVKETDCKGLFKQTLIFLSLEPPWQETERTSEAVSLSQQ